MSFSGIIPSRFLSKAAALVLTVTCLLVLPGCWVTSINGLDEGGISRKDPDLAFDAGLVGSWITKSGDCASTLTISADNHTYEWQVVGCTDHEDRSYYRAQLFKLDNHYFLDVTARPDDVCEMCIAIHWIFLMQIDKDSFSLTPIDSDGLKKALEQKLVPLTTLSNDSNTLTSSPKDLKAFCHKYADDKETFKPDPDFTFKRK